MELIVARLDELCEWVDTPPPALPLDESLIRRLRARKDGLGWFPPPPCAADGVNGLYVMDYIYILLFFLIRFDF